MFKEFVGIAEDSAEYVRYKHDALQREEEALRKRLGVIEQELENLNDIRTRLDEYRTSGNKHLCPVCFVGRGCSVETRIGSDERPNVFICPKCDLEIEVPA